MPVEVRGLEEILRNMQQIPIVEAQKANENLRVSGGIVEASVLEHAQHTDHTLEDLAMLGHPYSRRYPTDSAPHPDTEVHIQSGLLFDNIRKEEHMTETVSTVEIGVKESDVPYISDLINGTRLMRPRNFIGAAWDTVEELVKGVMQGR